MTIYLDAARMGRICQRAQSTVDDFLRFHAEEGSSVHFDEFLRRGFSGPNVVFRDRYPGLCDWQGIPALKRCIRQLANAPQEAEVLFAASSAQLMRVAAKVMFEDCRNVFTVDITWPDYRNWLWDEANRCGGTISELRIHDQVVRFGLTHEQLLKRITAFYIQHNCDGIFIPAVSNLGIRLPYKEIIEKLRSVKPVNFVIVDGAQDFCHIPTNPTADLYLAGCHKWMQAYLPLRMGICCRQETRQLVKDVCIDMLRQRNIDDPLTRFTQQLEDNEFDPFIETANLLPLFTCAAAVTDQLNSASSLSERFECQLRNAQQLEVECAGTGWNPILPARSFRSGIVLMEVQNPAVRGLAPDEIRARFRLWGITLSAYDNGVIRLSMPLRPWTASELLALRRAFASFDQRKREPLQNLFACDAKIATKMAGHHFAAVPAL